MGSAEFDADHLSHSPNNYAPMSDAVSSDQQCKLPGNFDRAAYLQRCSSLGPITNETGNRVPAKFNACGCHSLHPTSQLECEQSAAQNARPGPSVGPPTNARSRRMVRVNAVHCRAFLTTLSSLVSCCRFCRCRRAVSSEAHMRTRILYLAIASLHSLDLLAANGRPSFARRFSDSNAYNVRVSNSGKS
jgi:hypothetical protein